MHKNFVAMLTVLALLAGLFCGTSAADLRFPPPEFETDHQMPEMAQPPPRAVWKGVMDAAALALALGAAAWIVFRSRSRQAMVWLTVGALAYFGFYRAGCVCPIGAIQNVSLGLADPDSPVPFSVLFFFALPLLFALFFGRVFCSGVCPLGAIQDIVLVRPVRVPGWLGKSLSVVPFIYLGLGVYLAATGAMFVICRYDPFVGFFRLSGRLPIMLMSGAFLVGSVFVGRPYCRFLCPYGALLSLFSRTSKLRPSITPDECVVCGLCTDSCPFGAIVPANTEGDGS